MEIAILNCLASQVKHRPHMACGPHALIAPLRNLIGLVKISVTKKATTKITTKLMSAKGFLLKKYEPHIPSHQRFHQTDKVTLTLNVNYGT